MPPNRILTAPSHPGIAPGTTLIETDRLIIRRVTPGDAAAHAAAANHVEIWKYMTDRFPSPYTLKDAEEFIASAPGGADAGEADAEKPELLYPTRCGIFLKQSEGGKGEGVNGGDGGKEPVLIGSIGITPHTDINYRTWELGYWITPSAWGKGYAAEAVGAFVRWVMTTWPEVLRIYASTFLFNEKSGKVLERCGFVREGVRRDSAEKEGRVVSEVTFGLVRSDLEG